MDIVDGIFIGPADLSGALGHLGHQDHPEVQAAIADAVRRIQACGRAAGILTASEPLARRYFSVGCSFVAVGLDTSLLVQAAQDLARKFKA